MSVIAKIVKIIGYVLTGIAVALIGIGILSTWWFRGFGAVQELFSPFNVVNYLVTIVTLAPGFSLIWLAEKLELRAKAAGPKT